MDLFANHLKADPICMSKHGHLGPLLASNSLDVTMPMQNSHYLETSSRLVKVPSWRSLPCKGIDTPSALHRRTKYQFSKETNLVRLLCGQVDALVPKVPYIEIHREWANGTRVADICLGAFRQQPPINKLLRQLARLSFFDQAILARTASSPIRPTSIANSYFLPLSKVEESLQRLLRAKLVSIGESGLVQASEWQNDIPIEIHMVEAKLEDWQYAVHQAASYRPYGDAAWVAMPLHYSNHAGLHEKCFDQGVGLILVKGDGSFTLAIEPAPPDPSRHHQKIQTAIRLLRRFVLDSENASPVFSPAFR